jgi:GrpB-like predicted nucleotidyltransferase (UPF0157 family)/putative NADPH-quinone reductase
MSFEHDGRLEHFIDEGLGLERDDKVRLISHNERWKRVFSDEAYLILHCLNIESLKLYHCGSTAIKNIVAKPIIDIVGSIESLELLDNKKNELEHIGYEYKGEYGIKGRRFCVLYNPLKTKSFCHLHIFKDNSDALFEHIGFRDYLRNDRNAALKYEKVKKSLDVPRSEYSNAKAEIITELLSERRSDYLLKSKSKVLVIVGAAKGHNNTVSYARNLFVNNDVEIIDLLDYEIDAFDYGNTNRINGFITIVKKMIDADKVFFATPIYWYSMSGEMKNFIDRFSDLLSGEHKELGEKLYGKKMGLLSTGSDLELSNGFTTPFNLTATYFGMDFMDVCYKSFR